MIQANANGHDNRGSFGQAADTLLEAGLHNIYKITLLDHKMSLPHRDTQEYYSEPVASDDFKKRTPVSNILKAMLTTFIAINVPITLLLIQSFLRLLNSSLW